MSIEKEVTLQNIKRAKVRYQGLQKLKQKQLKQKNELNDFFVTVFFGILKDEAKILEEYTKGKLSISEVHTLQSVGALEAKGQSTLTKIAEMQGITQGTISTAIHVLEKKGFISREQSETDKRITYIKLTESGQDINFFHNNYHAKMINYIVHDFNEKERDILLASLRKLTHFLKEE